MGLIRTLVFLAALVASLPAWAIDGALTITSAADVGNRRTTLLGASYLNYPGAVLPSTLPTVTPNVTSSLILTGLTNVARFDQYAATMSVGGFTNTSFLYVAGPVNNGKVVFQDMGHQFTCDWNAFDVSHSYNTKPMVQKLLSAGFSVFAMNMPDCGYTWGGSGPGHMFDFTNLGVQAMRLFIEPFTQAMNKWDQHVGTLGKDWFTEYDCVGLSGGGFQCTIAPAIDPRITKSVAVAGSQPHKVFVSGACATYTPSGVDLCGDGCAVLNCAEQNWASWYTVAGFEDLYAMAAQGTGRKHVQILNMGDDCCFGPTQWNAGGTGGSSFNYNTYYGHSWAADVAAYAAEIYNAAPSFAPASYTFIVDSCSTSHQISTCAQQIVMDTFIGPSQSSGSSLYALLHR